MDKKGSEDPMHSAVKTARVPLSWAMLTLNESFIELATKRDCPLCQLLKTYQVRRPRTYNYAAIGILSLEFDARVGLLDLRHYAQNCFVI